MLCSHCIIHIPIAFFADHDYLFYVVYEKVKYAEDTLEPHLWTYRSRVTLEHLRQSVQGQKMKDKYPILSEFLQAVRFCCTIINLTAALMLFI